MNRIPNYSRKERSLEASKASGVKGQPAVKFLRVKFFAPNAKRPKVFILRAGNGRAIIPGHELDVIAVVIDNVENAHPFDEFELVQLTRKDYNIVWRGPKPVQAEEIQVAGVALGEVTTVTLGEQP